MRRYTETRYGAKSWQCERRVAARIEASTQGLDIRYVVTNLSSGSAEWLYDTLYCARGQAENLIKLHKSQLASDRTSCRSALANQVRLVLHTAAYWLMLTVRDAIPKPHPLATAEFTTLRAAPAQDRRPHHRDRHTCPHRLRRRMPRGRSVPQHRPQPPTRRTVTRRARVPRTPRSRQPPTPDTTDRKSRANAPRIESFRCRRGQLAAERRNRGYTLYRASSGAHVARLRPIGQGDRVEVLYWSLWKECWTKAGPGPLPRLLADIIVPSLPAVWMESDWRLWI